MALASQINETKSKGFTAAAGPPLSACWLLLAGPCRPAGWLAGWPAGWHRDYRNPDYETRGGKPFGSEWEGVVLPKRLEEGNSSVQGEGGLLATRPEDVDSSVQWGRGKSWQHSPRRATPRLAAHTTTILQIRWMQEGSPIQDTG